MNVLDEIRPPGGGKEDDLPSLDTLETTKEAKSILFLLIGVSGSGKSRFGTNLSSKNGIYYLSSDETRELIYGTADYHPDKKIQDERNRVVWGKIAELTNTTLERKRDLVFDATNRNPFARKVFVDAARKYDYKVVGLYIKTDIEIAKARNDQRDRKVPHDVINDQLKTLKLPIVGQEVDALATIDGKTFTDQDFLYTVETQDSRHCGEKDYVSFYNYLVEVCSSH